MRKALAALVDLVRRLSGQDDDLRKLSRKLWRGGVLLVVVAALAVGKIVLQLDSNTHHIEHQQVALSHQQAVLGGQQVTLGNLTAKLRQGAIASCHRVNLERAKNNRNQLHDYRLYSLTITLFTKALAHPEQPTTASQRAIGERYLAAIRESALAKEWTPLTQCALAVDRPFTYPSPASIRFKQKLPPPGALRVGRGE